MTKVVIVTGASGGLGSAIARSFAARGNSVVLNYQGDYDKARALADEINCGPGQAFVCKADVRSFSEVQAMVDATIERWQRVDVLVNNAGGAYRWLGDRGTLLINTSDQVWDIILAVNLKGSFNGIKAVAPRMIEQRDGHIINIGSGVGLFGTRGYGAYAAAKSGLLGLAKTAARELGEYNIKVNTVCPGVILHQQLTDEGMSEEAIQQRRSENVLGRTGSADELADFIVHVTTMHNISGQLLSVDSKILF